MTDVYDRFEAEVLLFRASTVRALLELRALVRDIELSADNIREGRGPVDAQAHHYFRVKATYAAGLIPDIKALLEREGGTAPADTPLQVAQYPNLPLLPAPAFPEASKDLRSGTGGAA